MPATNLRPLSEVHRNTALDGAAFFIYFILSQFLTIQCNTLSVDTALGMSQRGLQLYSKGSEGFRPFVTIIILFPFIQLYIKL